MPPISQVRPPPTGFDLPVDIIPHVTDHADAAELTLWFFGIDDLVRSVFYWWNSKHTASRTAWVHVLLFAVGAGGLLLLVRTGDLGARLVFQYSLGVQAVVLVEDEPVSAVRPGAEASLQIDEDGSWRLIPGVGASEILSREMRFVQGKGDDLTLSFSAADCSLALDASGRPVIFTAGDDLESVEVQAMLRLDDFDGSVRLVHHVQDAANYHFLEIVEGGMRQGRVAAGREEVFDSAELDASGWLMTHRAG